VEIPEVKANDAKKVLVASGAALLRPLVKGIELPQVHGALDILAGRTKAGSEVAVIGGGLVGCETAEYLAAAGHKVTVLEMLPEVGQELGNHSRWVVMVRLKKDEVKLLAETRVDEMIPGAVRAS
jgi:2,4-dienoyl-CoA reductase (NADPH2)